MSSHLVTDTYPEIARDSQKQPRVPPDLRPPSQSRSEAAVIVLCSIVGFYLALSFQLLYAGIVRTGVLTFPLDDTYITMAIAKNFSLHGIWNINPTHFVSATSCPLFALLLSAAYRLTGPTVWWPLALSLGFGLLAVIVAWRLLRSTPTLIQAAALALIVAFTPLHVLGLLGMEHTLHIVMVLLFLDVTSRALAERKSLSLAALLLVSAMVMVRYESLFLVAIAGLLFLEQRQIRAALAVGLAAATPIAVYGIAAVRHGGYWLPNSVALKGASVTHLANMPNELARHFLLSVGRAPYMGALMVIMIALLELPAVAAARRARAMLDLVLGATLIHLALADVDWAYRYEAYLIAAAIAAIALGLNEVLAARSERISAPAANKHLIRERIAVATCAIFAVAGIWLLSERLLAAERSMPERTVAIHSQQIQMAEFLKRYETGAVVAANDVGAINFFANIDCMDLVGLADQDVFWLARKGLYNTAALAKLSAARGVEFAIVYDSWFASLPKNQFSGPPLPRTWIRVGRWRTPYGRQYLGDDTVSFYATNPAAAEKLRNDLRSFEPSLPAGVQVADEYVVGPRPDFSRAWPTAR